MTTVKEFRDSIDEPNYISAIHGDGSIENPMRFFEDEKLTVSSESYDKAGTWAGWREEVLKPKEYFERRLKGK